MFEKCILFFGGLVENVLHENTADILSTCRIEMRKGFQFYDPIILSSNTISPQSCHSIRASHLDLAVSKEQFNIILVLM